MSLRDASRVDLPAIDRVFRQSFCDTFAHLYDPRDLDAFFDKFTPEAWAEEFADGRFAFRVAEAGGQVVGYLKLGPLTLPVESTGAGLELRQIYILKDYHGRGLAAALVDWALEQARSRGADDLYLTVFTENERARRVYERYGFKPVGRYAFMVGEHADEDIIMRKSL